jgi:hypothetical protein
MSMAALIKLSSNLLAPICVLLLTAAGAGAIDFYEIQIDSTETTPPGILSLELHSNSTTSATGAEAHEQIDPYQIHETLEGTYRLTPHIEIGQYFATAKLNNGDYEYAGSALNAISEFPRATPGPSSSAVISNWITCAARRKSNQ